MPIDLGNTPTGTPPDSGEQAQLCQAIGALPLAGGTMDTGADIAWGNGSYDREAPGGAGREIECSIGYRWQWIAGRMQLLQVNTNQILKTIAIDGVNPGSDDDGESGFVVGSRWETVDGTIYECTDATDDNAIWSDVTPGISPQGPEVKILASSQSTAANTTPIALTGMTFSYEANATYKLEIIGAVSSAVPTTGYAFSLDLDSAITAIYLTGYSQLANAGTLVAFSQIADAQNTGLANGVPTANTAVPVSASGILITSSNSGTAQLQYRSEVAAVTTCLSGTALIVTKIL